MNHLTKDEVLKLIVSVCDPNTVSPIEKDGEFIVVTQDELLAFANAIADAQRDRICAAIKAEDDHCADGDYMMDSNDCIEVVRGTWKRPEWASDAIRTNKETT